jgi:hypothetical protein
MRAENTPLVVADEIIADELLALEATFGTVVADSITISETATGILIASGLATVTAAATAAQNEADAAAAAATAAQDAADAAAATASASGTAAAAAAATAAQGVADAATAAATAAQGVADAATALADAQTRIVTGGAAADIVSSSTTITGGNISTGSIQSGNYDGPDGAEVFADAGSKFDLDAASIITTNFVSTPTTAALKAQELVLVKADGSEMMRFDGGGIQLGNANDVGGIEILSDGNVQFRSETGDAALSGYSAGLAARNGDVTIQSVNDSIRLVAPLGVNLIGSSSFTTQGLTVGSWDIDPFWKGIHGPNGYLLLGHQGAYDVYLRAGANRSLFLGANNGDAIQIDNYNNIIHKSRTYIMDGTAANPAIVFLYDQQTGPYRNATNEYAVSTGGAESLLLRYDVFRSRGIYNHGTTSGTDVRLNGTAGRIGRFTSSLRYKRDVERFDGKRAFDFVDAAESIFYRSNFEHDADWGIIGMGAEPTADIDEIFATWDINVCVCGLSEKRRLTHLATETAKEHGYDDAGFDDWEEFPHEHPNECLRPQAINESAVNYALLVCVNDLRKRVKELEDR